MKRLVAISMLVSSAAMAGEKSLMCLDISVDAQAYRLQKMVTNSVNQYRNPLWVLYENPIVDFAAALAIGDAMQRYNEQSISREDFNDQERILNQQIPNQN